MHNTHTSYRLVLDYDGGSDSATLGYPYIVRVYDMATMETVRTSYFYSFHGATKFLAHFIGGYTVESIRITDTANASRGD